MTEKLECRQLRRS